MKDHQADKIKRYLSNGTLPKTYPSTKSNFKKLASKYTLSKRKILFRNGRPVVTEKMKSKIFESLHQHSGRTCTWEKIKAR